MASKRIANNNGAQDATLNSVKSITPKYILNGLSEKEKPLAESILNNIFNSYMTRDIYENEIASTSIDAILGRTASLLDEVKDDFTSNELAEVKDAIIDSVNKSLENLPKNNDTIDVLQLTTSVISKIDETLDNKLETLKNQLQEFITTSMTNESSANEDEDEDDEEAEDNSAKSQVQQAEELGNQLGAELAASLLPLKEQAAKDEKEAEETKSFILIFGDIVTNQLNTIDKHIFDIENTIKDASQQVVEVIEKSQQLILEAVNKLSPDSKDLKELKKVKQLTEKVNKAIDQILETVQKLSNFFDNIIQFAIASFGVFLNGVFKTLLVFWLKLMVCIIVPTLLIIGAFLYLLAEPLMAVLLPIMDFVDDIFTKILDFLKPIRDFLLDVLKRIFDAIEPALIAFFRGLASVAEQVAIGLGLFVSSVLNVLKMFMDGIASGAFGLGKALVKFATAVVDVLAEFMRGLATMAFDIGQGLGRFVKAVVNVLADLMEGFGTQAKAIGEAIGKVVLGVCNVVGLLVQFLEECVGILVAIVGTIRDFFEGIRSKAKAIGEIIATGVYDFFDGLGQHAKEIGDYVGRIMVKVLKMIDSALGGIRKMLLLKVVAPWNGFMRKVRAFKVKVAENFIIKVPWLDTHDSIKPWNWDWTSKDFHPFGFLTGGMTKEQLDQAHHDQGKDTSELIADEVNKMEERLAQELKNEELRKFNELMQMKKMQLMLDNMHVIDDIFTLVREIHSSIFGEEHTTAQLSIQAVQPQIDQLNGMQLNQNNQNLQLNLEQEKQQSQELSKKDAMNKENKMKSQLNSLFAYLDEKFESVLAKLDKPQIVPLPLHSGFGGNMAGMEDM